MRELYPNFKFLSFEHRLICRLVNLRTEQQAAAFNPERLIAIASEMSQVEDDLQNREEEWLEITLALES